MRLRGFALSVYPVDSTGHLCSKPFKEVSKNNKNNKKETIPHFECKASQQYAIKVINGSSHHVAIEVLIDGVFIGGYAVELAPNEEYTFRGYNSHITNDTFVENEFTFPEKEPFSGLIQARIFGVVPRKPQMDCPIKRGQYDKSNKEICCLTLRYNTPNGSAQQPVIDLTGEEEEEEEREREGKGKEERGSEGREKKRREENGEDRGSAGEKESGGEEKEIQVKVEKEGEKKRQGESESEEGSETEENYKTNGRKKEEKQVEDDAVNEGEGKEGREREESEEGNVSLEVGDLEVDAQEREEEETEVEEREVEEQEVEVQEIEGMETDERGQEADEPEVEEINFGEKEEEGRKEEVEEAEEDAEERNENESENEEQEEIKSEEIEDMEMQETEAKEESTGNKGNSAKEDEEEQEGDKDESRGVKRVINETNKSTKIEKVQKVQKTATFIDLTEEASDDGETMEQSDKRQKITAAKGHKLVTKKITMKKITKKGEEREEEIDNPPTQVAQPFPPDTVIDPLEVTFITTTNQILSEQAQELKLRLKGMAYKNPGKKYMDYLESILPIERKDKHKDLTDKILKIIYIKKDDPRKGLRGKRGVAATTFIKGGTIIGPYAGKMWGEKEHTNQTTLFTKLAHNMYTHDFNIDIDGVKIIIDALQYGNLTRYINDPIIDPTDNYHPANQVANPNVKTQNVLYKSWPYVLVVATRDINPNEEILMKYGEEYWAAMESIKNEHLQMIKIQQRLAQSQM